MISKVQSTKLGPEKSILCSSAGVIFFHSGSQRTLRLAGNWWNGTASLWIYSRSWKKTNYTPHSIKRKIAVDVIVKSCQMWWNAVKSCQISPIYLSLHHKLVAITSLSHPTATHEGRQCTSLNLRVLLQNHLDRPWPATSWSWCKPMKCCRSYSVSSFGAERRWLVGAVFLWLAMILARRQKAKILYIMSHQIKSNQHCKSWVVSPKIWNRKIWWSGDLQADLGFQKVLPDFSTPTCHDRSTPNGSSAGSWWQSSQTPERIQTISSSIDLWLFPYVFCQASKTMDSFHVFIATVMWIKPPIGLHVGIHLSQKSSTRSLLGTKTRFYKKWSTIGSELTFFETNEDFPSSF